MNQILAFCDSEIDMQFTNKLKILILQLSMKCFTV